MKLCSIASGSNGNCIYVGTDTTHLLVDAGISGKRIEAGLQEIGVPPGTLHGIFITHEHTDHVLGVGILARKYGIPIYGTKETIIAMQNGSGIGKIPETLFHFVNSNRIEQVGDMMVEPFSMSHDASNPVCYTFSSNGHKFGMATDLGMYDDYIISKLTDSQVLYLEANHDENMLMVGKYPYSLKQRIMGNRGHLSNESSAGLICELLHEDLKYIVLAHMSKENNYAELAYETVRVEVEQHWNGAGGCPVICVANRDIPSEPVIW